MSIRVLKALHEVTGRRIPDADALVERASGDVSTVRRNGDCGNAVFDAEDQFLLAVYDIPETDCLISGAGSDVTSVAGEVERVNVLLVAGEDVLDRLLRDIPHLKNRKNKELAM